LACTIHPAESRVDEVAPPSGRAMTRCECASMSFAEVARRLREERVSLDEVGRRTGCGRTCTACLPDLQAFLARD
jgi:bacterioferritin-associated ferredoxin